MTKTKIPADIDQPDRIFAGLTLRQLAILSLDVLVIWVLYKAVGERISLNLFAPLAGVVAAPGLVVAMTRPDGLPFEKFMVAGVRAMFSPRHRVMAPEGVVDLPSWARGYHTTPVRPIELPLRKVSDEGWIDLGEEGVVMTCRVIPVNFGLRSETEQQRLVEAFGQFLNSLDSPFQILIRSERADLRPRIAQLKERARYLPSPALEQAAVAHARFLDALASRHDVLSRRHYLCIKESNTPDAPSRLIRRLEEASSLLRGMGVRLELLNGRDSTELLQRAADPDVQRPPATMMELPTEIVRGVANAIVGEIPTLSEVSR